MGKRKDVNREKIVAIITLLKTGLFSYREIARKENVSHQTVIRLARRMDEDAEERCNKRQNCRRRRKTTPRTDRRIVQKACINRFATLRQLYHDLQQEGIMISPRTLRRRLYENHIKSRRPRKKPKLSAKMRTSRLNWARVHRNYTVDDWKKVIKFI